MTEPLRNLLLALALTLVALGAHTAPRGGDYIVVVINRELVTNGELEARIAQVRAEAQRNGATLPADDVLRQQVLDALIEERVLVSHARDSGMRVDEPEVDRALAGIAAQNKVTMEQLREELRKSGMDIGRLRATLRDQLLVERLREREVGSRIAISDAEIDAFLERRRAEAAKAAAELNIAQILVAVPEGATLTEAAARRARIDAALARVRAGEPFDTVARELSEDANRERGGELGMKPADRLPDLFVEATRTLKPGEITPAPLRSGAGFHILKLLERKQTDGFVATQTRARHILLRPTAQSQASAAAARLADFKRRIEAGAASFEALAREHSQDGSAPAGGDLGWAGPGGYVPEFEQAMNALPTGGISAPVVSRFGVHLIQVIDRREVALDAKQVREQARNALREQKFDAAYNEWADELRARAYIEVREPPSQ